MAYKNSFVVCAPKQMETQARREALGIGAFNAPIMPTLGQHKTLPDVNEAINKRNASLIRHARPTDLLVYVRKTDDARILIGMVRKADDRVMWRKTTTNGFGAWHVLQGYTKRMPKKELYKAFDLKPYINAYTVDARHVIKTVDREDRREIRANAPHDRRPQVYNQKARRK